MPTVSIVIPVYNAGQYLNQCMDSMIKQSHEQLEILCVDDGSLDNSYAILQEYASQDSRIRVICQKNSGPGEARNRGMEQATGEYILFFDADDWAESNMIESMLHKATETGADVTICRSVCFDTHSEESVPSDWTLQEKLVSKAVFNPREAADSLFQFTYGWAWDKLYRTDFLRKYEVKFPALRNSEDLVFTFSSLALAECIALNREVLVHHRVNRKNSVSNSRETDISAPYKAAKLLRTQLQSQGIYDFYERSFLNWELNFLVWNAATLDDRAAQKDCFLRLQQDWLPTAGFDKHPARYYFPSVYLKYLLVKSGSFDLFCFVLRIHRALFRQTQ